MQRLVYEWVKTSHLTCKEYLDLCDWICEHTSLIKQYGRGFMDNYQNFMEKFFEDFDISMDIFGEEDDN